MDGGPPADSLGTMREPRRQPSLRGWRRRVGAAGSRPLSTVACAVAVLAASLAIVGDIPAAGTAPAKSVVVANGGFESGLTGWSAAGAVGRSHSAHGGRWSARVGATVPAPGTASLSRAFSVPGRGGALRLWFRAVCRGGVARDWVSVTLTDNVTHTSALLAKTCTDTGRWVRVSANLGSQAGHSVRLKLAAHDDGGTGSAAYAYYDGVTVVPPDFALSTTQVAATLVAGASTRFRVSTAPTAGVVRGIRLSTSGLPRGVTAAWKPAVVRSGGSSTLTLTAAKSATVAPTLLTITGRSSVATHAAKVMLSVTDGSRPIDKPAVDQPMPAKAVVNVKRAYGARGDGVTDDTAAIQRAISAGLGVGSGTIPHKTLYFPNGTYLVSRSLMWKLSSGTWSTSLTMQGENRDQTVIRLEDHAPGFANAANPRGVIDTGSLSPSDARGSGNRAFDNFIFNLTVDVGAGNPGAVGIDYLANNRGAIRNVVVRASDGSGVAGIGMTRPWPGPCLLQDVRVIGFGTGIQVTQPEYSVTMEDIDLVAQRAAGLSNTKNVLSIHNLTSTNRVPAVVNRDPEGMVTLVDATLAGGSGANPAVEDHGKIYIRSLTSRGYRTALSERGSDTGGSDIGEYSSGPVKGLFSPTVQRSLDLPIRDAPAVATGPPAGWASVATYGAVPDGRDNTAAIQAALDSGKATVYFPPGWYEIRHTLEVGPGVREILGFESSLSGTEGAFADQGSDSPLLHFTGGAGAVTVVRQLFLWSTPRIKSITDASSGTVFLQDVQLPGAGGGYTSAPGAGPLFLDDVEGPSFAFADGQHVWARQLNPEGDGTKISNNGGTLWVLGLKTELPSTVLRTSSGGSSELLGGLVYPVDRVPAGTPAFVTVDSSVSLIYAVSAYNSASQYTTQVEETRGDVTRTLDADALPRRGAAGSLTPLYVGFDPSAGP